MSEDDKNDDFMEIINHNNMQHFMSDSAGAELMTVRDLHIGLKFMAEAMMHITSFIDEFYVSVSEDNEEERPGLTLESVMFLKNIFENCQEFCISSLMDDDDFDDDDDDYDDDDEDDE